MDNQDNEKPSQPACCGASGPKAKRPSILSEFLGYLLENKAWWMIPIIVMILLLGLALALSSTPLAPFIYTLF